MSSDTNYQGDHLLVNAPELTNGVKKHFMQFVQELQKSSRSTPDDPHYHVPTSVASGKFETIKETVQEIARAKSTEELIGCLRVDVDSGVNYNPMTLEMGVTAVFKRVGDTRKLYQHAHVIAIENFYHEGVDYAAISIVTAKKILLGISRGCPIPSDVAEYARQNKTTIGKALCALNPESEIDHRNPHVLLCGKDRSEIYREELKVLLEMLLDSERGIRPASHQMMFDYMETDLHDN